MADEKKGRYVDVVFDGPPAPEGPRFIEVDGSDGRSVSIGEWEERSDGYAVLRLRSLGPDVDPEMLEIAEFNERFGLMGDPGVPSHLTRRKLAERVECMLEELQEFADACGLGIVGHQDGSGEVIVIDAGGDQNLPAQADALIDMGYFVKGTAVMLGLPWRQLWVDVHGANMRKIPGVGHRGHGVDVVKPPGWQGPQTEQILIEAGYDFARWMAPNAVRVDEARCLDDQPALEEATADE